MGMGAADPWSGVPYNAGTSSAIPGSDTYAVSDWYAGNPTGSPESTTPPTSSSAVPGTSGAPPYTPSATPGGVMMSVRVATSTVTRSCALKV